MIPWTAKRVLAVQAEQPERYRALVDLGAGCGLRQGEIPGIGVDASTSPRARCTWSSSSS